ncbi:hypothetical protein ROHU_013377 [Labeo rohita]|uniref:Uncharacterized protein n=1 Tax=Labeo rohita TaxID=84645 RepID=A0A498L5B0_LABRO|nr:hypothetical protein ROHU_013377 [Labeo rohita]
METHYLYTGKNHGQRTSIKTKTAAKWTVTLQLSTPKSNKQMKTSSTDTSDLQKSRFAQGLRLRQADMLQEGITRSSATLSKMAD